MCKKKEKRNGFNINSIIKYLLTISVCLIISLITFLLLPITEKNEWFLDALSIGSTITSIILSVVAIFYTIIAGHESKETSDRAQQLLEQMNNNLSTLSSNSEKYERVLQDMKAKLEECGRAIELMKNTTTQDKNQEEAVQNLQTTVESMKMFLGFLTND